MQKQGSRVTAGPQGDVATVSHVFKLTGSQHHFPASSTVPANWAPHFKYFLKHLARAESACRGVGFDHAPDVDWT